MGSSFVNILFLACRVAGEMGEGKMIELTLYRPWRRELNMGWKLGIRGGDYSYRDIAASSAGTIPFAAVPLE